MLPNTLDPYQYIWGGPIACLFFSTVMYTMAGAPAKGLFIGANVGAFFG